MILYRVDYRPVSPGDFDLEFGRRVRTDGAILFLTSDMSLFYPPLEANFRLNLHVFDDSNAQRCMLAIVLHERHVIRSVLDMETAL
jgi:hypothetical protein